MGWETRRGRRYYYRARKVGGRVVKEYVGTGPEAEALADEDAQRRLERRDAAEARRMQRDQLLRVDSVIDTPCSAIETLMSVSMPLAGFHRHHRGEWRRQRDG